MSGAAIPLNDLCTVSSWGEHLGVKKGWSHLARIAAARTLCGIEYPLASVHPGRPVACGTCAWIANGSPRTDEEWDRATTPGRGFNWSAVPVPTPEPDRQAAS